MLCAEIFLEIGRCHRVKRFLILRFHADLSLIRSDLALHCDSRGIVLAPLANWRLYETNRAKFALT